MSPAELSLHRRNTAAFIAADPVAITLSRRTRVSTGAGGYKDTYAALPGAPQTLRMIPAQDKIPEIKTSSGRIVKPEYTLLGTWNSNMQEGDRFTFNGVDYELPTPVRPLHSNDVYERKADVIRRD